jgi:hypothetical protein
MGWVARHLPISVFHFDSHARRDDRVILGISMARLYNPVILSPFGRRTCGDISDLIALAWLFGEKARMRCGRKAFAGGPSAKKRPQDDSVVLGAASELALSLSKR